MSAVSTTPWPIGRWAMPAGSVAPLDSQASQEHAGPTPGSVRPGRFEQPLDSDRQVADPDAGGVEDSVGDSRGHPDRAEFAYSLGAERAGMGVRVVDEGHVYVADVGVDRHQVTGQVLGQEPAQLWLEDRSLQDCLAVPPGDAPDDLAARGQRVDDPPGGVSSDAAWHPDKPEVCVHPDLDEDRAVGVDRVTAALFGRVPAGLGLQRVEP